MDHFNMGIANWAGKFGAWSRVKMDIHPFVFEIQFGVFYKSGAVLPRVSWRSYLSSMKLIWSEEN